MNEIGSAATDMQTSMTGLRDNAVTVSGALDPLRAFVAGNADCAANPLCAAAEKVVRPVDQLVADTDTLAGATAKLNGGSRTAGAALAQTPASLGEMNDALGRARTATGDLAQLADRLVPQLREVTGYLTELSQEFAGSGAGGVSTCPSARCQTRGSPPR